MEAMVLAPGLRNAGPESAMSLIRVFKQANLLPKPPPAKSLKPNLDGRFIQVHGLLLPLYDLCTAREKPMTALEHYWKGVTTAQNRKLIRDRAKLAEIGG